MFGDPDSTSSRRELFEVRDRFECDFGGEYPSVLDQALAHPLGSHELGALEAGERGDEPDLALAQDRSVEREVVEDRADRVWRDELAGLAAGNDRAAAPEHDLLNSVELARAVHPHDVHRARGRTDPEDARDARVLGPRIER